MVTPPVSDRIRHCAAQMASRNSGRLIERWPGRRGDRPTRLVVESVHRGRPAEPAEPAAPGLAHRGEAPNLAMESTSPGAIEIDDEGAPTRRRSPEPPCRDTPLGLSPRRLTRHGSMNWPLSVPVAECLEQVRNHPAFGGSPASQPSEIRVGKKTRGSEEDAEFAPIAFGERVEAGFGGLL